MDKDEQTYGISEMLRENYEILIRNHPDNQAFMVLLDTKGDPVGHAIMPANSSDFEFIGHLLEITLKFGE